MRKVAGYFILAVTLGGLIAAILWGIVEKDGLGVAFWVFGCTLILGLLVILGIKLIES